MGLAKTPTGTQTSLIRHPKKAPGAQRLPAQQLRNSLSAGFDDAGLDITVAAAEEINPREQVGPDA